MIITASLMTKSRFKSMSRSATFTRQTRAVGESISQAAKVVKDASRLCRGKIRMGSSAILVQTSHGKRAVMETNYFGVLRCIKCVVPQMREHRSGTIINVSSVAGTFCYPPATPYCASKWALEALSKGLACEMKAFGVRVALVEPGIIDTAMAQRISTNGGSAYPHAARIAALFTATLNNAPVPPSIVAQKILEIAQSDSWQFRHPVGPDAEPLIAWRKGMTDRQWVDLHSADDGTFQQLMGASTGGNENSVG